MKRLANTSRAARRSLPQRMLKRLIVPSSDAPKNSGWKQWFEHLQGNNVAKMKELQSSLMKDLKIDEEFHNELLMGEINQWHFRNDRATIATPTLLLHGYAATSMAFYRNFSGLSKYIKDLYAIDLPANGLSSTLPLDIHYPRALPLKVKIKDDHFRLPYTIDAMHNKCLIQNFEDYYLDALEQWRIDNKLDQINIVAHSFGGYLSFKYAVKYPHSVKKLCLVSPLGVERSIYSINNQWRSNMNYRIDYDNPSSKFYCKKMAPIPKIIFENQTRLLRCLGPLGAKLCWNYITAAYSRVPGDKYKEYIFELFYSKTGITSTAMDIFTSLFERNLLAKDPLLDAVCHLHTDSLMAIYGEHDWMNKAAGFELIREAEEKGIRAIYSEVVSSGHNLFLDNPLEFNSQVVDFLNE